MNSKPCLVAILAVLTCACREPAPAHSSSDGGPAPSAAKSPTEPLSEPAPAVFVMEAEVVRAANPLFDLRLKHAVASLSFAGETFRLGPSQLSISGELSGEHEIMSPNVAALTGDGISEQWKVGEDTVEQSWSIEREPMGQDDLEIRVAVRELEYVTSTESGLAFRTKSGESVLYSHATLIDSDGIRTRVPARFDANAISITVPRGVLGQSRYPVQIDPTISGALIDILNPTSQPALAYNSKQQRFALAYRRANTTIIDTSDIAAMRFERDGTVVDATPAKLTTNSGSLGFPKLVSAGDNGFAAAWYRDAGNASVVDCNFFSDPSQAGAPSATAEINGAFDVAPSNNAAYVWGYTDAHRVREQSSGNPPVWLYNTYKGIVVGFCGSSGQPRLVTQMAQGPYSLKWARDVMLLRPLGSSYLVQTYEPNSGTVRDVNQRGVVHDFVSGAGGRYLFYLDGSSPLRLWGVRVSDDGALAGAPSAIAPFTGNAGLSVSYDGENFVVVANASWTLQTLRVTPDLVAMDPKWKVLASINPNNHLGLDTASDETGTVLVAYASRTTTSLTGHLYVRKIDTKAAGNLGQGAVCESGFDCASGFCVDGFCCDSACGFSNGADCQACSVTEGSAANGTCGVIAATKVCRGEQGPCDLAENCDGSSAVCPTDQVRGQGYACGPVATGPCDVDDVCDGNAYECPSAARRPAQTVCRQAAGDCDAMEYCDGFAATCPDDQRLTQGTICRPSAGPCDAAEACSGAVNDCPSDVLLSASSMCRAALGPCDAPEQCTGLAASCPPDVRIPEGTICRDAAGDCDVADLCDGSNVTCDDTFKPEKTSCRAAEGSCDTEELCTGRSPTCPADAVLGRDRICRPSVGLCDRAEFCSGNSGSCPSDRFAPNYQICRQAVGECDQEELCTALSAECPADVLKPETTVCRESQTSCDPEEHCSGESARCPGDVSEGLCVPEEPWQPEPTSSPDSGGCTIRTEPFGNHTPTWAWLFMLAMVSLGTARRRAKSVSSRRSSRIRQQTNAADAPATLRS